MTALRSTNITTTLIDDAISEGSHAVFTLCSSDKINKWSRKKPVIGTWPTGNGGLYGLNLTASNPNKWDYVPIVDTARMGDFRGYEHDKDVAGPVIYCKTTDITLSADYFPNMTPTVNVGEWIIKANQSPHADVQILPTDLTLENYYLGLKLHIGTVDYYRTYGNTQVHDIGVGGQERHFDLTITDLVTKGFTEWPSTATVGQVTWTLFISTAACTGWETSAPTGIIYLPGNSGETYGSKTIQSTGTFNLHHWLVFGDVDGHTQVNTLTFPYNHVGEKDISIPAELAEARLAYVFKSNSAPEIGINSSCEEYSAVSPVGTFIGGHFDFQGYDSGGVPINPDSWVDGTMVQFWPKDNSNTSLGTITKPAIFGLLESPGVYGEEATISLIHEDGRPVVWAWTVATGQEGNFSVTNYSIYDYGTIGLHHVRLTFTLAEVGAGTWVYDNHPDPIPIKIVTDRGLPSETIIKSDTFQTETDGTLISGAAYIDIDVTPHTFLPGTMYTVVVGFDGV